MDLKLLRRHGDQAWEIPPQGRMRVPAWIYADEALVRGTDHKVYEQAANVAMLPGIVGASFVMPDAHWGYGFPIGGVAAFDADADADAGGMVSAGGVGFDVSGGARWAVHRGWGSEADLERTEERGQMLHAKPGCVSAQARRRQQDEMGTLGSGNHYLEVQEVAAVHDEAAAAAYGLRQGDIVVMIHCGSRGLGHQIGTEFLRRRVEEAPDAYKDVDAVVESAHAAGLARKVAKLAPMICVKG